MISSRTIVFQFLNITDVHKETRDIIDAIQHLIKYKSGMRNRTKEILKKCDRVHIPSLIEEIGSILFEEEISNEGIIEMFYFCNKLAKKLEVSNYENYIPLLAECLSRYLILMLDDWIVCNESWRKIVQLSNEKSNNCLYACLLFFL